METPDVTAVQKLVAGVAAAVPAIGALLIAFGVDISTEQLGAVSGAILALGAVYVLADALIRRGRASVEAARVAEKPYDSVVGP